jgi:hypothetical protein
MKLAGEQERSSRYGEQSLATTSLPEGTTMSNGKENTVTVHSVKAALEAEVKRNVVGGDMRAKLSDRRACQAQAVYLRKLIDKIFS